MVSPRVDNVQSTSAALAGATAKGSAYAGGGVPLKLPVPATRLVRWNAAMCAFHTALAVVTLAVGNRELRVPVYASTVGLNVLGNNTRSWALVPGAAERGGWLYLTYLCASFFLLSATFHLGNGFLWRKAYLRALESAYAPFRWIEYSFSASIMILILAYTSGTINQNVLVLLFSLTFVTMTFGHLHEVVCRPASLETWSIGNKFWRLQAHLFGYIPQLFAWGVLIAQFMEAGGASTTDAQGNTRQMPAFVYGIVFGELLIFWSFGIVQLVVSLRPPSKYYQGEIAYMWLSLFAKGFLGIIVLSNVLILGSFTEIFES